MINLIDQQATEKAIWWLGETKGFWVQTGAFIISAVGGVWIVFSRSRTERRRATVDLVLHQRSDRELKNAKKTMRKLREDGQRNFAIYLPQKDGVEYKAIMSILNTHEFVAGGIREKAYDEELYKRMQCSVTVRDWDDFSGFVAEFRNAKGKTFYQDFEWLAKKWKKDPLKPSKD